MALSAQEQAELAALESEMKPQASRSIAAPSRSPGDLQGRTIKVLSPDEEAELIALESEFGSRPDFGATEEKSFGDKVMTGVNDVGNFIDSYTGAPTRKAINTLVNTGSPIQAASDFGAQFGEDPNMAPTGKEVAKNLGFNDQNQTIKRSPMQIADEARAFRRAGESYDQSLARASQEQSVASPAEVAGVAIDVAADPLNLVGVLPFTKIASKAGKAASTALKGSANAVDMATGTKFVKVGEAVKNAGTTALDTTKEAKKSLVKLFRPDIAPDFNELSEIAAKNGIDKSLLNDSIEFGENSVISRHSRSVAEGPLGGEALKKHDDLVHAVSTATENNIKKIAKSDYIANDVEAGGLIREAYDEGVDRFFNSMGETYNSAIQYARNAGADLRLDKKSSTILNGKLNQLEQWAKGRIGDTKPMEKVIDGANSTKRQVNSATKEMLDVMGSTNKAITKTQQAQAREVLNAVKLAKNAMATSGGDLGQVYQAMRDIGEIAFKTKNSLGETPSDVRKFQELYFSLQKGMTESIRSGLGDDFANSLIENNKAMSKFFTERGQLAQTIGNKNLADEKVFQSLIMNGDSKKVEALFNVISPEAASQLKASFLNNTLVRNADGVVNFASSRKKLNGLRKSGKLDVLFKPDELIELDDILKLGDRAGIGVLSTSGTGASIGFKNIVGTLQDKLANDTLIDNLKRGARSNYVEVVSQTPDGVPYVQKMKAPQEAPKKSGIQILREKSPITKKQAAQATREMSIQDRNEKIKRLKQIRGL